MATVDFGLVEQAIRGITDSIPGPQEGESVLEFRARVDDNLMRIVAAIGGRKAEIEAFIARNSDGAIRPADQFYNAARRRFIADEFAEGGLG